MAVRLRPSLDLEAIRCECPLSRAFGGDHDHPTPFANASHGGRSIEPFDPAACENHALTRTGPTNALAYAKRHRTGREKERSHHAFAASEPVWCESRIRAST
jgi:hypothetical protein